MDISPHVTLQNQHQSSASIHVTHWACGRGEHWPWLVEGVAFVYSNHCKENKQASSPANNERLISGCQRHIACALSIQIPLFQPLSNQFEEFHTPRHKYGRRSTAHKHSLNNSTLKIEVGGSVQRWGVSMHRRGSLMYKWVPSNTFFSCETGMISCQADPLTRFSIFSGVLFSFANHKFVVCSTVEHLLSSM